MPTMTCVFACWTSVVMVLVLTVLSVRAATACLRLAFPLWTALMTVLVPVRAWPVTRRLLNLLVYRVIPRVIIRVMLLVLTTRIPGPLKVPPFHESEVWKLLQLKS